MCFSNQLLKVLILMVYFDTSWTVISIQNYGNHLAQYRFVFNPGADGKSAHKAGEVLPKSLTLINLPNNATEIQLKIQAYYSMTSRITTLWFNLKSPSTPYFIAIKGTSNKPSVAVTFIEEKEEPWLVR